MTTQDLEILVADALGPLLSARPDLLEPRNTGVLCAAMVLGTAIALGHPPRRGGNPIWDSLLTDLQGGP